MQSREIKPYWAQYSLVILPKLHPNALKTLRNAVVIDIDGSVNTFCLKKAFHEVIKRHEMLRATIDIDQTNPQFKIIENFEKNNLDQQIKSLKKADLVEDSDDIHQILHGLGEKDFINAPFDLKKGSLPRLALIKLEKNKYKLVMMFNHLVIDQTSIGVILKDLSSFYNAFIAKQEITLPPLPKLADIKTNPDEAEVQRRLEYWKKTLNDLNVMTLPTDFEPQKEFDFSGKRKSFVLSKEIMSKVEAQSKALGCTLNQFFLGALYILLYKYSGETDLCVGITSANRRHSAIKGIDLVNCFFNTIPLRAQFSKDTNPSTLLKMIKENISSALENQLPLDLLFKHALSKNTISSLNIASPFNVMLVFNNEKPTLTFTNTEASQPVELDLGDSKLPYFSINIDFHPDHSCLCFLEYNPQLFNDASMDRLQQHFQHCVEFIAEKPDCKISAIPLLLENEKKLLADFKNNRIKQNENNFVPEIFHQRALTNPEHVFAVFHDKFGEVERITYQALDERATQLAHFLKSKNLDSCPIGISVKRSFELLIAMLAVLKVGAIAVPLETEEHALLRHKIKQAHLNFILADQHTHLLFDESLNPFNLHDPNNLIAINSYGKENIFRKLTSNDSAYIMFTSGTTGEPKGVELTHAGFANLFYALQNDMNLPIDNKIISSALPTFDAFLYDLLAAMATEKGQIHFCFDEGRFSPHRLNSLIRQEEINFGVFLPSLLDVLDPDLPLSTIISMGASPHKETLEKWANANKNRKIYNGLGHTETGICLTTQLYSPEKNINCIGQPIRNMDIFILDPNTLSVCSFGIPGEMYIAGPGLAKKYINGNDTKFFDAVFDEQQSSFTRVAENINVPGKIRLYASGDYACYQQDGEDVVIKFLGRRDKEVKINGVRISLDTVEQTLRNLSFIQDAVVIPNNTYNALTAYIIYKDKPVEQTVINKHLQTSLLPSVAYPQHFIPVSAFPHTPNGKIDLNELTQKNKADILTRIDEALDSNESEIRKIWAKVLNIPENQISIHVSYKQLGGDSLTLATLEAVLTEEFSTYIGINLLSNHMTIASLSKQISSLCPDKKSVRLGQDTHQEGRFFFIRRTPNHSPQPSHANTPDANPFITMTPPSSTR